MSCLPPGRLTIIRLDFLTTKIITKIRIFWIQKLTSVVMQKPQFSSDRTGSLARWGFKPVSCPWEARPNLWHSIGSLCSLTGPPFDGQCTWICLSSGVYPFTALFIICHHEHFTSLWFQAAHATVQRLAYWRIPPPPDAWNKQMVEGNNIRYLFEECLVDNSTIIPHQFSPKQIFNSNRAFAAKILSHLHARSMCSPRPTCDGPQL